MDGISVMKNFATENAISKTHLTTQEQFMLFGVNRIERVLSEGRRMADIKYNETVGINRVGYYDNSPRLFFVKARTCLIYRVISVLKIVYFIRIV